MKTKCLFLIVVCGLIPLSGFSQTSPAASPDNATAKTNVTAQSAPDAAEVTRLLKEFLDGAGRNDVAMHDRFWADDLIYTASAGRRIGKADIMREVREEPHPNRGEEETVYSAEDIRVQQYGTTAIVAFRLVGTTRKDDKTDVANYLNTGTFLERDGKWQVVAWQATKMPAEPAPQK
jgi:hypothetical protein